MKTLTLTTMFLFCLWGSVYADSQNQLLFKDDFNDGNDNGWTQINRSWHVIDGRYYLDGCYGCNGVPLTGNRDGQSFTHVDDPTWTDYTFEFTFDTTNAPSADNPHHAMVFFRVQGPLPGPFGAPTQYRADFCVPCEVSDGEHVGLSKYVNGDPMSTFLADTPTSGVIRLGTNTGKIIVSGGHIQIFVNNQLVVDVTDPDPIPFGGIGLGAIWEANAWFDDVSVTAGSARRPITLTFNTNPAGLSYAVDGTTYTVAKSFSWLSGSTHTLRTTSPQNSGGHQYIWQGWSDNGAISHTIAPTAPTAYMASFESSQPLFFPLADYQGLPIVELGAGSYTQAQLAQHGIANNSLSSIRVPAGFKIEAFDSADLTGTPVIISGDTPSLATRHFDNMLSSMRISRITVGATFYELCGRQGYNVNLPVGNYNASALAQWGIGDNQISQIIPVPGREVEIFDGMSFDGKSRLARESVCLANVGGGFDNITSSIKIRSSAIRFNDNFNDGNLNGWSPQTGTWSAQNGAMQGVGWGGSEDGWIYADPNLNFDGSIVLDADVNMVTGNARYVMNSTGSLRQTEYHVGIMSQDSPAYANRWQIIRYDNFQVSFPTASLPGAVDGNVLSSIPIPTRCHFTVRRVGGNFDVYINSIRIGSWTETTPLPALGKVGAGVVWDFTGTFDNFAVRR